MKMKGFIGKYLRLLVGGRAVGRMEQMRLMAFLLGAAVVIVGMPFHFLFDWMGHGMPVLRGISIVIWLSYFVILWFYFTRRLNLEKAFFALAMSFQTFTSLRIVYLAASATPPRPSENLLQDGHGAYETYRGPLEGSNSETNFSNCKIYGVYISPF